MLALTTSTLSFSAAPALAAVRTSAGVSMRQSEALPFLEAPPQLDGSMAGDVVSPLSSAFPALMVCLHRTTSPPDASAAALCAQGFDPLGLSGYYSLDYMREVRFPAAIPLPSEPAHQPSSRPRPRHQR